MDETQRARLQQIATDAQVGHWPPHLGLNTDAERIEFLAEKLLRAIDTMSKIADCDYCGVCETHGEYEKVQPA